MMFPLVFSHRFRRNPAVESDFEGDYYDQNPEWDADLPDIESESNDSEDGTGTECPIPGASSHRIR